MLVSSTSSIVSAVVGTDTVPVVASRNSYYHVSSRVIRTSSRTICRTKKYGTTAEGLLNVKSNTSDPSVAEAGVIVATVGTLLSIIVPVAETVPLAMLKVSSASSIVSAVVDRYRSVVAPAGTVTVTSVVGNPLPALPFVGTKDTKYLQKGCSL
jgi:hypothetical protein